MYLPTAVVHLATKIVIFLLSAYGFARFLSKILGTKLRWRGKLIRLSAHQAKAVDVAQHDELVPLQDFLVVIHYGGGGRVFWDEGV